MHTTIRTAARTGAAIAGALLSGTVGGLFTGTAAQAATLTFDKPVAYARDGAIFTSRGAAEKRLTPADGNSRPRWSPDGTQLAYLHQGELWAMNADGTAKHRATPGKAAGAAYAPDGQWLAYSAPACLGGPGVYRVRAAAPHGTPEVLFPAECRTRPVPAPTTPDSPTAGALADRLRYDDAVAWSPDGSTIAFRGGGCDSVYDNCLTIGTVATGAEHTVAGFGGGGSADGFAVVPAFRADGARLAWTTYDGASMHIVEAGADGTGQRQLGVADDRELTYRGTNQALVSGLYKGRSWIMLLNLTTGKRTPFHKGSQPN